MQHLARSAFAALAVGPGTTAIEWESLRLEVAVRANEGVQQLGANVIIFP